MLHLALLLAAAATAAPPPTSSGPQLYRVELAGGQSAWAMGKPQPNGSLLLFRHYPDGALMSVPARDVKRIVETTSQKTDPRKLQPGVEIEIGATGGAGSGGGGSTAAAAAGGGKRLIAHPSLGENRDGTALLDPNRPYNPAWDSTRVPGLNMAFPNAPNDYVEGKTIAHPPAQAVQAAPGDVPMAPPPPNPQ